MSIIVAILALGFLIFFHELGHFLAAKLCGVGVLEFSIGMGPRILSRVYKNTRYSLKLLPLGGSCAMLGEDSAGSGDFLTAEGEREDTAFVPLPGEHILAKEADPWVDFDGVRFRESEIPKRSFQNKPNGQRFFICIAGVLNNFILAFFLAMLVVFFCGFDKPIVLSAADNSPAAAADFQQGDILKSISVDGRAKRSLYSYRELYIWLYLHSGDFQEDSEITVRLQRDGESITETFRPYYDAKNQKYRLGLNMFGGRVTAEGPAELIGDAAAELRYNVLVVLDSIHLIAKGRVSRNEVMGPVGTVSVMSSAVQESTQYGLFNAFLVLLELSIMLSANLGVMNLLPIPALDGGRLLVIVLESLLRRRLSPKIEERINTAGMLFLLALMVLILGNDLFNLFSGAYRQ